MKQNRKSLKYWIGQIHLWLGLASGLVVFIVSITGCIFVFQKEISDITYKNTFFIAPQNTATLPLSILQQKAQKSLGSGQPVNSITTYKEPGKAWEFMAYKQNDTAVTYFGALDYFRSAFINPYTGETTGFRDYKYDFFNVVKYLHWSLLLNTKYGQPIVGWGTFIFVILLITGLVLWWPKKWNKATKQQSFAIKWKANYKRINYDLHNVPGFYSLLLALVIALTGMVYSFKWFEAAVYTIAAGTTKPPEQVNVKSVKMQNDSSVNAFDKAFQQAKLLYPDADRIGISPALGIESPVYISAYRGKEIYYDRDDLQFDQYSGRLLHTKLASKNNNGTKLIEMNYDIHVGAIGGIVGKAIAFIVSFICASLPVTGFLIWWWKRRKKVKTEIKNHRKDFVNASSSNI